MVSDFLMCVRQSQEWFVTGKSSWKMDRPATHFSCFVFIRKDPSLLSSSMLGLCHVNLLPHNHALTRLLCICSLHTIFCSKYYSTPPALKESIPWKKKKNIMIVITSTPVPIPCLQWLAPLPRTGVSMG